MRRLDDGKERLVEVVVQISRRKVHTVASGCKALLIDLFGLRTRIWSGLCGNSQLLQTVELHSLSSIHFGVED